MKILLAIILMMAAILALFFAAKRTFSTVSSRRRKSRRNPDKKIKKGLGSLTWALYSIGIVLVVVSLLLPDKQQTQRKSTDLGHQLSLDMKDDLKNGGAVLTLPDQTYEPVFTATGSPSTNPMKWGMIWEIFSGEQLYKDYERTEPITFGAGDEYFPLPGISTFRGSNYRDGATYGTADVDEEILTTKWNITTGILKGTSWAGSGWTGQPIIVQWDYETRQIMNLFPEKKQKGNLVEVIYPTQDGCIYFLDLDDGSRTREPMDFGQCFKGSGTLDPRGYPLLYVGSGDNSSTGKRPRMYIVSLIDGAILYQYGDEDPMSLREDNEGWCAFDSSPIVDAETDTLIWPGENGILYTIKLNTEYKKESGKISINPDPPVATRYITGRSSDEAYWFGYEASASAMGNYLYLSENGGMFYCVDLNTMELVWCQDTLDDSNSSPAFEYISADEAYIYTAPSLNWTKDENRHGTINIYKLNAITGEIVWQVPYEVYTVDGVSGGVQSSALLGKEGTDLEGLIVYTIARTPTEQEGIMVALDTQTGEEVWRFDMDNYAWSSPVAVYGDNGKTYVVVCDSWGYMYLIDGSTGRRIFSVTLGYLIEASPAVFEDTVVVGTVGQKIWAINVE